MDIRKFFSKRLKTDHCKQENDDSISDKTTEISETNDIQGIVMTGPERSFSSEMSFAEHGTTLEKIDTDLFDIGLFLNKQPNDETRFLLLTNPWKPNEDYNFKNDVSEGKRPFIYNWLSMYSWLAYSKIEKGALCLLCVLFKSQLRRGVQGGFINRPFTKYKQFHENAKSHAKCEWHREAVEKASNFLSIMKNEKKSVELLVNQDLASQIDRNREKLKPIISSVLFCALHDLPLRGKTDEHAVFNDLLKFREESGDLTLSQHLKNAPKNATYISHRVQNEIIDTCTTVLRNTLIDNIKYNDVFSILADETMDVSGVEQLSLGVRYFDRKEKCIKEDFLGFTPLEYGLDAEHLADAITSTFTTWGLNLQNAVGQGYDGCTTMAGHITGVHKRINNEFPMALYFHCSSHRLNLVVNDLNAIPQIRNSVGTIKEVIKFFRENGQRRAVVGVTLQKLCETRWTEKYLAVRKFNKVFIDIVHALETLSIEGNKDTKQKAFQLHCAVTATPFVICLEIISTYSSKLEIVTQMLQGVGVDLLKVSSHIQKLTNLFQTDRSNSEKEFEIIMKAVEKKAEDLGITLTKPRVVGKQCHRSNQLSQTETVTDYHRVSIFIPYLDSLIDSLKTRFSSANQEAFEIFKLHPKVVKTLEKEDFKKSMSKVDNLYSKLLDNFIDQSITWYDLWQNTQIDEEVLEKMHLLDVLEHENAFFLPAVFKAIQIALCLPPTTCTIERSFSTLRRVKTWIRSTISNNRLSGLCLMSVHRNQIKRQKDAFTEKVIDAFGKDTRRLRLLMK